MENYKENSRLKRQKIRQIKSDLGQTIQLLRKAARITQTDFGKLLSLHQTAVCRVEQGFQSLTIEELYQVAQFFDVRIDALVAGEIDYWKVSESFGCQLPIPKRYLEFPFSKVRMILPTLFFLKRENGESHLNEVLDEMKVPRGFLISPDQNMGVHCQLDLFRYLIRKGELHRDNLSQVSVIACSKNVQGFLHPVYESQSNPLGLIQTWVLNSHHYESHFKYEIESFKKDSLEISVTPEAHMKEVEYRDDLLNDILCAYKKTYFSHLPHYTGNSPLEVVEKECHFHGAPRCLYKLKVA